MTTAQRRGKEVQFSEDERIISTTDLNGNITSVNDVFIRVSGYSQEELIGKPHNIIRHPDMPKEAFGNLWGHIKRGKAWIGAVKNRCKNGDYYWVDAFVSPVYKNGKHIGYQSVRSVLAERHKRQAEKTYREIKSGKFPNLKRGKSISSHVISGGIVTLLITLISIFFVQSDWAKALMICIGFGAYIFYINHYLKLLSFLRKDSQKLMDNPMAQLIYSSTMGDLGVVYFAMHKAKLQIKTVLYRLKQIASETAKVMVETKNLSQKNVKNICSQSQKINSVRQDMKDISGGIEEISSRINDTSEASSEASKEAEQGKNLVKQLSRDIQIMAEDIDKASISTQGLKDQVGEIDSVVNLITEIAEQTNLLALNAAIEAARAGAHGRGFAVVADEVRTLANRTQESTGKIQATMEQIQQQTLQTAKIMDDGKEAALNGLEYADKANQALNNITSQISQIAEANSQLSVAAMQQSQLARDIHGNISHINDMAEETSQSSEQALASNQELESLVNQMDSAIKASDF